MVIPSWIFLYINVFKENIFSQCSNVNILKLNFVQHDIRPIFQGLVLLHGIKMKTVVYILYFDFYLNKCHLFDEEKDKTGHGGIKG